MSAYEALELIARGGCENYTVKRCWDSPGRTKGAPYTADGWCNACIAQDALGRYELTDRGFRHYEEIQTSYGHEIRIYESSAASAPHLWLDVSLTAEGAARSGIEVCSATAHCTFDQATQVRDTLDTAMKNHYQLR